MTPENIIISVLTFFVSLFLLNLSYYEATVIALFAYYFYKLIFDLGNSIWLILDVIVIQAILTWMVVPIAFFHFYNENNYLAVLWVKTMPISSNSYYSFVLPGTLALVIGLQENSFFKTYTNNRIKDILTARSFNISENVGISIIVGSVISYIISPFAPASLDFILYLSKRMLLVGFIYLYYTYSKGNYLYIILGVVTLIVGGIQSAMFGELIFLSFLFTIIITMQYKLLFINKFLATVGGVFLILLFQNIKSEYRKVAWKSGGDPVEFTNILLKNLLEPESLFDPNRQFSTAVRFNQGWLIASTMYRVPRMVPFAHGETIWVSLMGSIIPRFLWPDKPQSGGQYNLTRFLGYQKINYSMNISPLGEAYANFGRTGGIIFMFFYGLFFRYAFRYVLVISESRPTILFWIPILFQYSVGVETDVLSTVNSLIKSGIFVFALYKIWPLVFKSEL